MALALLYVVVSTGLLMWRHTTSDLVYFFVPFVLGPVGELFAVRAGAWAYADDGSLLPVWLPFAWGIAGLFMKNASEALAARKPGELSARQPEQPGAESAKAGAESDVA